MTDPLELADAMEQWSKAYPLSVFPEPDFAKADQVLKASGLSLSAISAANMRHVVTNARFVLAIKRLRNLQAENERLRNLLAICRNQITQQASPGKTHYEGCEADHPTCRLMREIDEALGQRKTPSEDGA